MEWGVSKHPILFGDFAGFPTLTWKKKQEVWNSKEIAVWGPQGLRRAEVSWGRQMGSVPLSPSSALFSRSKFFIRLSAALTSRSAWQHGLDMVSFASDESLHWGYPLVKHTKSYWKWRVLVDLPWFTQLQNGDVPELDESILGSLLGIFNVDAATLSWIPNMAQTRQWTCTRNH